MAGTPADGSNRAPNRSSLGANLRTTWSGSGFCRVAPLRARPSGLFARPSVSRLAPLKAQGRRILDQLSTLLALKSHSRQTTGRSISSTRLSGLAEQHLQLAGRDSAAAVHRACHHSPVTTLQQAVVSVVRSCAQNPASHQVSPDRPLSTFLPHLFIPPRCILTSSHIETIHTHETRAQSQEPPADSDARCVVLACPGAAVGCNAFPFLRNIRLPNFFPLSHTHPHLGPRPFPLFPSPGHHRLQHPPLPGSRRRIPSRRPPALSASQPQTLTPIL